MLRSLKPFWPASLFLFCAMPASSCQAPCDGCAPVVAGLSHVPLAVRDLEAASADFAALGFVLKPGRTHADGICNRHVKFADGTEIELITAAHITDALSAFYVDFLAKGDGPAFLALQAPELARAAGRLDAADQPHVVEDGLISLPGGDPLGYLFFAGLNHSPTDRADYFRHPNGADGLVAVWLAADDLSAERKLLACMGATLVREQVHTPTARQVDVAHVGKGDVLLLQQASQPVPGRRIVGVTLRTRDLALLRRALEKRGLPTPPVIRTRKGRSMFLPPRQAHGMWLEVREERESPEG